MAKCFRNHAWKHKFTEKTDFQDRRITKDSFQNENKKKYDNFWIFPENKEIFLRGPKKDW